MKRLSLPIALATSLLLPGSLQAEKRHDLSLKTDKNAEKAASGGAPTVTVAKGDTLGAIAAVLETSIDQLVAWNPGLDPDRIRIGQKLLTGAVGRHVEHAVQPGETVTSIVRRFEVSIRELSRWNRGLRPDHIRIGQKLTVYTNVPLSRSKSVGSPSAGRLIKGQVLPKHPGYVIRRPKAAWGTEETVHHIVGAFQQLKKRFPKAPKLRVHDLSYKGGGRMFGHRSHQSGRDVDISYFQKSCESGVCPFRRSGPGSIDAKHNWALLKHWLDDEVLEAVFIDYKLQKTLYREAKRNGATKAELGRWFQYPRGASGVSGIIRHFPKHADHMHVRFACHGSDEECKSLRPLLTGPHHATR